MVEVALDLTDDGVDGDDVVFLSVRNGKLVMHPLAVRVAACCQCLHHGPRVALRPRGQALTVHAALCNRMRLLASAPHVVKLCSHLRHI